MSRSVELKSNTLSVTIDSLGAQLQSVKGSNGTDFLWCGDPNVWSGRAPVLFPICGGLKDDKYILNGKEYTLAKHGYARFVEYAVEKCNENTVVFLAKSNDETKKGFPYDYEFRVIYVLKENSIEATYQTTNLSDSDMYFSVGAHEAYACPEGIEQYDVVFDKKETLDSYILDGNLLEDNTLRVLENSDTLPLKYEFFKVDALVFKNINSRKVTLVHKNSSKKVTVNFEGHDYFLLWTKPDAKYICIEPWCGIQDSVNSDYDITKKEGIIKLSSGKVHSVTHTISFQE